MVLSLVSALRPPLVNQRLLSGETRVLVRGGPFGKWEADYPKPLVSFNFSPIKSPTAF